jgi:energy-coupling factor transporter ATP-binding protein EcfA2
LLPTSSNRFGIVAKKDLYPTQLSGGQQQLVGVARAIVAKPAVILADEPTGNLHSSQAQEIMELFKQLNDQGTTYRAVTHSETNAAYGARIIKLRDGYHRAGMTAAVWTSRLDAEKSCECPAWLHLTQGPRVQRVDIRWAQPCPRRTALAPRARGWVWSTVRHSPRFRRVPFPLVLLYLIS